MSQGFPGQKFKQLNTHGRQLYSRLNISANLHHLTTALLRELILRKKLRNVKKSVYSLRQTFRTAQKLHFFYFLKIHNMNLHSFST